MKNIILFTSAILLLSYPGFSQEVRDAIRYGQDNVLGTARYNAMSGAFGAVGGDFSSLNSNPAGAAIFTTTQVAFTMGISGLSNKSDYFGTETTTDNSNFNLNQAGGIFVFNNVKQDSNWKKFTLGANYESNNNFDNSILTRGTNPTTSVADYFLSYANANPNQLGIPLNVIQNADFANLNFADQQAYLGYQGFIVNPVNAENAQNTAYVSNVPAGGNYRQVNAFESTGYSDKISFNVATSYKDRLYLGLNINTHFSEYRQSTTFSEANDNSASSGLKSLSVNNDLFTYGNGFSFGLGAIGKVTESFRIGLSYESPTWYQLYDELTQSVSSRGFNYNGNPNISFIGVNPQITVIYPEYRLRTAGKYGASAAYVFGKKGLLSVDYYLKDYSNMKLKPDGDFGNANANISNSLTATSEVRVGGEYRIKQFSLRGGMRYEQSPYDNGYTIGHLEGYTGGLGYDFGGTRLDIAYSYSERNTRQPFFTQGFTGAYNAPLVNSVANNITLTLAFGL